MEGEGVQKMSINRLSYVPPKAVRVMFPKAAWESRVKKILLTIDDSPSRETVKILDILDEYGVKSLFFVNVDAAGQQRETIRLIAERGHLIGNHSMTHRKLAMASNRILEMEIIQSKKMLEEITGTEVKYFRPPYGSFDPAVYRMVEQSDQRMVMWSLLTGDYTGDPLLATTNILKYLKQNSIVVMHDNEKSEPVFDGELAIMLEIVKQKGYEMGRPEECLR